MSDEYIKKQDIINAIANTCFWLSADNWDELTKAINGVKSYSFPDREKGEWICIDEEDDKLNRYKCSRCGEIIKLSDKETLHDYPFSHCGADMRGEANV